MSPVDRHGCEKIGVPETPLINAVMMPLSAMLNSIIVFYCHTNNMSKRCLRFSLLPLHALRDMFEFTTQSTFYTT